MLWGARVSFAMHTPVCRGAMSGSTRLRLTANTLSPAGQAWSLFAFTCASVNRRTQSPSWYSATLRADALSAQ
eukprot:1434222-Amphidinium_carterae.1